MISKTIRFFSGFTFMLSLVFNTMVLNAFPEMPGGAMGNQNASSVTYSGSKVFSSSTSEDGKSYTSSTGGENALLVSAGESTITNPNVNKSGDESSESSDFYGTNAGVLVYNGSTLNISGGNIITNGSHANAVFAYGSGTINISGTAIRTNANNSGGIMVTGGGVINASDLDVLTSGNSSASIRSDRGGGTLTVNNGTYKTTGVGSPSIYSTASITVENAELISEASEGIVVEGANSVTIKNTILTDTNTTLNGQSETYKNIFLYQSQSGDAAVGTSYFTAEDSEIITNKGDTFYITNTNSVITLSNNTFVNNDGDFLRAEGAAWGSSSSNGGKVTLYLNNQTINGNIVIDSISSLNMNLLDNSIYKGAINKDNLTNNISLSLTKDSIVVLNGDSYISVLNNEVEDNSNIYLNGYNLYVNGNKIEANEGEVPEEDNIVIATDTIGVNLISANKTKTYLGLSGLALVVILIIAIVLIRRKK